mmetsp:Transcript_20804/g.43169  ORF Transcript_20804/g.43169 Transcript_20804/m.43169 type:complete len:408 (+) Transcript_20804:3-1226(+)
MSVDPPVVQTNGSLGDAYAALRIPLGHPPVVLSMPGGHDLAATTIAHLGWRLGSCSFKKFNNGEISVKVEQPVTNADVYIVHGRDELATETNFAIMQLMLLIDAVRGESPYRLTVVLPCLDYARQDRRLVAGESIPPKLLLRCMKTAGADRFLAVDLHNQAEAAFCPVGTVLDELCSDKYLADFIRCNVPNFSQDRMVVCATDGGGLKFTRHMADELRVGFMMVERFRKKVGGVGEIRLIADADPESIDAIIIVDDMFDTCGNMASVCIALHEFAPSAKLYAIAPHGYFSAEAHKQIKKLVEGCNLEWIAVTNSVAQTAALRRFDGVGLRSRLKVIDISKLLAGAILRVHLGHSVNLPKFRNLCPSTHDPMLQDAALVPQQQYTHLLGVQEASVGDCLYHKRPKTQA